MVSLGVWLHISSHVDCLL